MYSEIAGPCVMAEPKKMASIKLPMDIVESARIVSAYQGVAMADLLADILRPVLRRLESEEMAKRRAEIEGEPKAKKPKRPDA
jgi:hypothetical protein